MSELLSTHWWHNAQLLEFDASKPLKLLLAAQKICYLLIIHPEKRNFAVASHLLCLDITFQN